MATSRQKEAARRNIEKARQAQSARAHGEMVPRQGQGMSTAEKAFADASGVRLMTRNQRYITTTFPEIAGALNAQRIGDLVADGEIVATGRLSGSMPAGMAGKG